jgi:hypothetical protein
MLCYKNRYNSHFILYQLTFNQLKMQIATIIDITLMLTTRIEVILLIEPIDTFSQFIFSILLLIIHLK